MTDLIRAVGLATTELTALKYTLQNKPTSRELETAVANFVLAAASVRNRYEELDL